MKRYKKYMFIILSVLLAGGCVQEDINEALRREAELNVRMGNAGMDYRYNNEVSCLPR